METIANRRELEGDYAMTILDFPQAATVETMMDDASGVGKAMGEMAMLVVPVLVGSVRVCVWERLGIGACWWCVDGEWCGDEVFLDGDVLRNGEGVRLPVSCSSDEFRNVLKVWRPLPFPSGVKRVVVEGLSLDEVKRVLVALEEPVPAEDAYLDWLCWKRPHWAGCVCLGCDPFFASDDCFIGLIDNDTTIYGFVAVAQAVASGCAVWDPELCMAFGVGLFDGEEV